MSITKIYYIIVLVIIMGCSNTRLTSFTDPNYKTHSFLKVLVMVDSQDLEKRVLLENRIVEEFKSYGVSAIQSVVLLPPTREFSDEQKIAIIKEKNIDSYLIINVGKTGNTRDYIPQTTTSTTTGRINPKGKKGTFSSTTTTTTIGGYTVFKPWARFETKLHDSKNNDVAWISSSVTNGSREAKFATLINSFSQSLVEKLLEDRLFIEKETE